MRPIAVILCLVSCGTSCPSPIAYASTILCVPPLVCLQRRGESIPRATCAYVSFSGLPPSRSPATLDFFFFFIPETNCRRTVTRWLSARDIVQYTCTNSERCAFELYNFGRKGKRIFQARKSAVVVNEKIRVDFKISTVAPPTCNYCRVTELAGKVIPSIKIFIREAMK